VVLLYTYGDDPQRYLPSAWFHGSGLSKKLRLDDEPIAYEDLAEILDNLLTHDAEVTRDAASRLVVEVFLPRNLINREIDQLQIAPAGFARPIGTQHPVVVRPIERLRSPVMHREWRRKWEWLRKHGADRRATAVGIHAITEPVAIEPRQLLVQLMGDSTPVGIIMAFPPAESDSLGSDEYAAGVHSGAPLMIWCRDQRPAVEFLDEIQGLLAGHGLLMIPELISRYRQRAHYPEAEHQHLGRHLTLLWDDFDRKPDEESGSLSAPARGPK
jgi:hypothetical protein